MSKSTSKRTASPDWSALLNDARQADRQLTAEELALWSRGIIDGEAYAWARDFVVALQESIEQRNHQRLLAMLDAGLSLPRFLVPVLGLAFRCMVQGSVVGQPAKLNEQQHRNIRFLFDVLKSAPTTPSHASVQLHLAQQFGVSTDTIKRSLNRTKPPKE